MIDQEVAVACGAYCLRHKRERVTHVCTDNKCHNNAMLCAQCFAENVNLSYHYDHEASILGVAEAVERISVGIKNCIPNANKLFKSTLGRGEHLNLLQQIEKGAQGQEELEQRISTIKNQVELELDLLLKDFQKVMLIEKQEYFKLLDSYQRSYLRNMDYIRAQVQPLLEFQASIRYFGNPNTLCMKLMAEARKKSEWFPRAKKTLLTLSKMIEIGSSFSNEFNSLLASAGRAKLDIWPAWKGEENIDKTNDLRYIIKRAMNQWAYIPELKPLNEGTEGAISNGSMGSGKNYYPPGNK